MIKVRSSEGRDSSFESRFVHSLILWLDRRTADSCGGVVRRASFDQAFHEILLLKGIQAGCNRQIWSCFVIV